MPWQHTVLLQELNKERSDPQHIGITLVLDTLQSRSKCFINLPITIAHWENMLHYWVGKIRFWLRWRSSHISGLEGSQISRHSAHEGGKFVTPTHRRPLPPGISWYSFLETESTPDTRTCRILQKKSPVTRPGIDPGTFRLIAQRLNQYATTVININLKRNASLLEYFNRNDISP